MSRLEMGLSPSKENIDTMKSSKVLQFLQQSATSFKTKTVNRANIKPNVIYQKDTRDQLLLMTEKDTQEVPVDKHGYYGGFSPERKPGSYHGSKIHNDAMKMDKAAFDKKK